MFSPSTFFLVFFLFFTFSFAELCNPNDKKALLNIKKAFNNPNILSSWKPQQDCRTWSFIQCDEKSHNLQYLDLSYNNLSGTIPEFLTTLPNLLDITLSGNKLTGTIPSSLSKLRHLDNLKLDRNKLTGTIPDSLGSFKAPSFFLYLSHNQLSGRIPPSFSRVDFTYIDLSNNKLEGDASMIFGARKSVSTVDLSKNLLEFNLSNVVFSTNLASLDLCQNKIFGGLPPQLTKLEFEDFNVSSNQLCGSIPTGGKLQSFDVSAYLHNKCLCGAPLESCK